MAASSSNSPFSRARLASTLTTVQHVSALVFGSFLFVHLAAPAAAAIASTAKATDTADRTMLLGRDYYQSRLTEPLVVYGAAAAHVLAGLAKRAMQLQRRVQRGRQGKDADKVQGYRVGGEADTEAPADKPFSRAWWRSVQRRLPNIHTLTGLALAPAMLIHVSLNRWVPKREGPPIFGLSSSELDYNYVTYGFLSGNTAWRAISWVVYGLLLGAGAVHVVSGTDRIARRMRSRRMLAKQAAAAGSAQGEDADTRRAAMRRIDEKRKQQRKAAATTVVSGLGAAWLALGLAKMVIGDARDGAVTGFMSKRVQACYAVVWPYSMWA